MNNQLQRLGYFSRAYHNGSYDYYNRNMTHENLGYSKFIGVGNGLEEGLTGGEFPHSDKEMIEFTLPQYIDEQPFSVYYMTISGHPSYGFSSDTNDMAMKNRAVAENLPHSTTVNAYIACNLELEYAMESLLQSLEDAGIADDTVVVIVPDHYPYGLSPASAWGSSSGNPMYRKDNKEQLTIEDFFLPFGGKLDAKNRWVRLAKITPWERIEEYYLQSMSQETGRGAISARIAFGAVSLRQSEKLSDEDTVRYIQENPYVQYYLGLHEFHMEPLFDSSMMVHFRKRFPIEFVAKVNEYICIGKWPEEMRDVDRNDHVHHNIHGGHLDELTPYIAHELIKAIYVGAPDKSSGKRRQNIYIQYDLIGFIPLDELMKQETA